MHTVVASHAAAVFALQHLVLDAPSHSFHLDGAPALAVLLAMFGLVVFFIVRFLLLRRRAHRAAAAQVTAETELRTLFAAMQDVVFVVDREGNYVRVPVTNANARYRQMPNLVGQNIAAVLPERAASKVREVSAQVLESRSIVTAEYCIEFERTNVWFEAAASLFDDQSVLWVARDVTETKAARDALAASETRYRLLFDRNPCAMWVYDYDTLRIVEVNDAAVDQYGYSRDEFSQMTLNDLRGADEHGQLRPLVIASSLDQPTTNQVRHRKKDGSVIDVEIRAHPLGVARRNLRLVVCTDITERLAAERIVRDAEARATETSHMLQSLVDAAPQAMVVLDSEWCVTRWNGAAEALFGWTANEVIGGDVPFIPENQRESVQELRHTLSSVASGKSTEVVRLRKDGKQVDLLLAAAPLRDSAGKPTAFIAVYTDLTDLKRLEQQLHQSQKMEAIGTLAGGIAHDFNNILTVISSYSSMLLMDERYPEISADLDEIRTAARRATGLTRQLLTFSRKAIVQLQPLDVNTIVNEMEPMLRRLVMEHIDLIIKPGDASCVVTADISQIEQILLNLTVNAADAMPDGGSLVIETHTVRLDEGYAELHSGVEPGAYVLLAVTDSGIGMDAETIAKIFEPFFTTKEVGRGTGLGLATVYAIVKQLGGHIWVYSEPGHGAAFKIYLPREMASAASDPVTVHPIRAVASGTVLLVEDDIAVRRAARRMLEKAGFTVLEAQDGEHGLSVAENHPGDIDVVVTDLMMPKMSGGDFALKLSGSRPGSRVVFTSGYTDDSVLRRRLVDSTHAFVQKPFTGDQLVRTIVSLMDGTAVSRPPSAA